MNKLFILVTVLFALGCSRNEKDQAFLDSLEKEEPTQEAYNVKFIFSEKALTKAILEAPHVQTVVRNNQEVSICDEGVHLIFYTPEGNVQSELTADYGEFMKEFGQALVRGNVVVINERKERMETEKLEWDNAKDSIYTREFVKVYTEDQIIYGDGIRAKSDFSGYKFYHMRGAIRVDDSGEPASPVPGPNPGPAPTVQPQGQTPPAVQPATPGRIGVR